MDCVYEEIASCVDRVFAEAKAHVEKKYQRGKDEVLSDVFTKVQVKMAKYVHDVIAVQSRRAASGEGARRRQQERGTA